MFWCEFQVVLDCISDVMVSMLD